MIDFIGELRRIMNASAAETFDPATDSLEAIRDFLAAMGGGVTMDGEVTAVPGANQFTIPALAGHGAGAFADAVAPWWALVFRDAGGAGAAPQGEMQPVTAYVTADGTFTTAAFTAAVAVGDHIILMNPVLAAIGRRIDAATADDLSDITTTSASAKIRRILARMSPDAFTADIQGVARTELDTMLGQLATYFVAVGAAMSIQINGNAARTNLQQVWQDFSAVFGADGANVFNPTIQGAGQTDLDAALAQLAIYFAAAGAAMSVQVNGGAARANLELILEDYFAVVGCDGANVFNPTIQGAARTTLEAAFDGLAAYFVAAGAALSVTIDPGGVARTTLATLWNDLGQMLAGAAGITTWPASSPPGNGISIAEAIRQIYDDIAAANSGLQEQADTPVNITAILAAETDVLNLAVAATRYIVRSLRLKCADPGANTVTVRLYELVNDVATVVTTFTIDTTNFTNYFSLMDLFGVPHLAGDNLKVTVQASGGGPYAVTGQYSHATAT